MGEDWRKVRGGLQRYQMKIVMVAPFFHPVVGGMENHVLNISKELIKKGHAVEVWTSNLSREGKIKEKEGMFEGIKIKRFNAWFKLGQFASFFPGVFKETMMAKADLIHVHNFRQPIMAIPLFTNKPCLLTAHWPDYPQGLRKNKMDSFARMFDKVLARFLLKKYKRICVVSPLEVPFIQQFGVPKEKIVLVPNGIPANFFSEEEKRYCRVKWSLKENDLVVLSLSRLHKSKGFDVIVRVAKKFPQVKFVIAGKDEGFKAELQQLIESVQVKNVFLVGEIPEEDKKKAFAAADIFVHPSHFEAFGIVVLEAMAQGKPVITSDVGGLPWVVKDAGLLFQDNNVNELEDRLKRLLYSGSLRKKLSENAIKRAKVLTWEKITDHLEKVYREIL